MSLMSYDAFMAAGPETSASSAPSTAPSSTVPPSQTPSSPALQSYDDFMAAKPIVDPNAPPVQTATRTATQLMAAGNRWVSDNAGLPVDLATKAINSLYADFTTGSPWAAVSEVAKNPLINPSSAVGGSEWIKSHELQNPDAIVPVTGIDKIAAGIGSGLVAAPFMALGAGALGASGLAEAPAASSVINALSAGSPVGNATIGAAAGGTGAVAAEAVPEPWKPVAEAVGNLAGGVGAAGIGAGLSAAGRTAGSIAADTVAPITAAGRERIAAGRIMSGATDPAAARAAIVDTTPEEQQIVPGSQPTVAQLTQDPGLAQLERTSERTNPATFQAVRQAQSDAQMAAAQQIAPPGSNPQSLGDAVRLHLDALTASGDQAVADAQTALRTATEAAGGNLPKDANGAVIRENLEAAKAQAKGSEGALWKAIDPDGTLALDLSPMRATANEIRDSIPQNAAPLDSTEDGILARAQAMPATQSFTEAQAFRSRLLDAIRQERMTNGQTPALNRMTTLRASLDGSIATAVDRQAAAEAPGIADGTIPAQQSTAAKLAAEVQDWYNQRYANTASGTGGNIGSGASEAPGAGSSAISSLSGAKAGPRGGSGGTSGTAGISSQEPLTPNWDADAAARYQAARAATVERVGQFNQGPVDTALRTLGNKGDYKLADEQVAGKFFNPGPRSQADIDAFNKVAANRPEAVAALQDYAASSLKKAASQPDGSLSLPKYTSWMKAHDSALNAFPELRGRFQDMATAQGELDGWTTARANTIRDFQTSAAGRLLGDADPVRAVGKLFGRDDATAAFAQLKQVAQSEAQDRLGKLAADAGLKRSVLDYMIGDEGGRFINADGGISAAKLGKFVDSNQAPLRVALGSKGLDTLNAISADLNRGQTTARAKIPAGSDTVQNALGTAKASGETSIFGHIVNDLTHGAPLLALFEHGGKLAGLGSVVLSALRRYGMTKTTDLIAEAMANPAVAKELLLKYPTVPRAQTAIGDRLASALARSSGVAASQYEQQ